MRIFLTNQQGPTMQCAGKRLSEYRKKWCKTWRHWMSISFSRVAGDRDVIYGLLATRVTMQFYRHRRDRIVIFRRQFDRNCQCCCPPQSSLLTVKWNILAFSLAVEQDALVPSGEKSADNSGRNSINEATALVEEQTNRHLLS